MLFRLLESFNDQPMMLFLGVVGFAMLGGGILPIRERIRRRKIENALPSFLEALSDEEYRVGQVANSIPRDTLISAPPVLYGTRTGSRSGGLGRSYPYATGIGVGPAGGDLREIPEAEQDGAS